MYDRRMRDAQGRAALLLLLLGLGPTLAGEPTPLFDGKTLEGWEGNTDIWRVEDGVIVGNHEGRANNEFLATKRSFADFHLTLRFRLKDGRGNSGIQFRSEWSRDVTGEADDPEMIGYQADVGERYWGCLYDESRRRKILVQAPTDLLERIDPAGWNTYEIRCVGPRVILKLNGITTVDYTEPDADIPRTGKIALQVHSATFPVKVEFTDIRIREL